MIRFKNGNELTVIDGKCDHRGDPYKISDEIFKRIVCKVCYMCETHPCSGEREDVLRCLEKRDKGDIGICGNVIFEQTELEIE